MANNIPKLTILDNTGGLKVEDAWKYAQKVDEYEGLTNAVAKMYEELI